MSVAAYLERASRLALAAGPGVSLQRILDRAMAGDDGALAPGEGEEARRLLALVRWERVVPGERAYLLKLLAHEPWWRERGNGWMAARAASFAHAALAERGLLTEQQEGRAA